MATCAVESMTPGADGVLSDTGATCGGLSPHPESCGSPQPKSYGSRYDDDHNSRGRMLGRKTAQHRTRNPPGVPPAAPAADLPSIHATSCPVRIPGTIDRQPQEPQLSLPMASQIHRGRLDGMEEFCSERAGWRAFREEHIEEREQNVGKILAGRRFYKKPLECAPGLISMAIARERAQLSEMEALNNAPPAPKMVRFKQTTTGHQYSPDEEPVHYKDITGRLRERSGKLNEIIKASIREWKEQKVDGERFVL